MRTREGPKRTWMGAVKKDMLIVHGEMALSRAEWKKMIHVAGPKLG